MKLHQSPIIGRYAFGADSTTYRGLPKEALSLGFDGFVRTKVLPELAATGIRRVLFWMPGGFTAADEPDHNMSFRAWTMLHANADDGRSVAATMEAALGTLEPHVDELAIYLGDLSSSLPRLVSTGVRAFLGNLSDCLGPFANHPRVSFALDASSEFKPDSLEEYVFQSFRAWHATSSRATRMYREGAPNQQYPTQWRDPGYITDESLVTGMAGGTNWFPPLDKLTEELIVQQPNGDFSSGDNSAKLIPWIDARVGAGFSVCVAPEHLMAQAVMAARWARTPGVGAS